MRSLRCAALLLSAALPVSMFLGFAAAEGGPGIIDVHEHLVLTAAQTRSLIQLMDSRGVATMFLLDTPDITFDPQAEFDGYDETVERQLAMKRLYPDRLRVFYTFPSFDGDGPRKAAQLAARGIDGLKFYNGVLPRQLGAIDSPAMYAAFAVARAHRLPVILHAEALQPLQRGALERVLDDFREVTFECPHLCGVQNRLEVLDALFAHHPNLFTDAGPWHRVGAFATREPEKFRDFYIARGDRIMFATDTVREDSLGGDPDLGEVIDCEVQLMETKYFSCFRDDGAMTGLYLPRATLDDIYYKNAARVFGSQRNGAAR